MTPQPRRPTRPDYWTKLWILLYSSDDWTAAKHIEPQHPPHPDRKSFVKYVYLGLTILGTIVPYIFFAPFFAEHGLNLGHFIQSLFVNGPAAGFTSDILISSVVFWLMMFRSKELPLPLKLICLALNLTIGLSAALPFYAYLLETRQQRLEEAGY